MNQFVIAITARDRVGIVRDVAGCISDLDGNIAELSQTVLQGYFTMILLAAFSADISEQKIKRRLRSIRQADESPIKCIVFPANPTTTDQATPQENLYVLTASGPDQIGFVAQVATFCADSQINIVDLATRVNDAEYVMVLQVDLSQAASLRTIQQALQRFSEEAGIQMVLQHSDIFTATHEITMPT
ncbi:MAG: ACT domain-containing protein [Chloroflexota bacterium]